MEHFGSVYIELFGLVCLVTRHKTCRYHLINSTATFLAHIKKLNSNVSCNQVIKQFNKSRCRREYHLTFPSIGTFQFILFILETAHWYPFTRDSIAYLSFGYTLIGSLSQRVIRPNPSPASVAQLDAPSDWRPGGRGFNPPAEVGNILSWRLTMKYFLRSFSPFRWFKKGRCPFLAEECAQYWLTS